MHFILNIIVYYIHTVAAVFFKQKLKDNIIASEVNEKTIILSLEVCLSRNFQSCLGQSKCFKIKSYLRKTTTVFVLNTRELYEELSIVHFLSSRDCILNCKFDSK